MRVASLCLLTLAAVALDGRGAIHAQEGAPRTYALALQARYQPLESVRDGTLRMPRPLARKVTVRRDGTVLQQVLLDIATQAGLGLSYGEDLARSRTMVSLELYESTAADALAAAVHGTRWAVLVSAAGQVTVVPAEERQLGSLVGRVSDAATLLPVVGAALSLDGTRYGAVTDDSGRYRLHNIPAGTYDVIVRRIGYARTTQPVVVISDQVVTLDVALAAAATALDRIFTTGVPTATSARTLGNSVTTIDAEEETRKANTVNVTELLQARAPGVTVLPGGGTSGTGASIRVRGAGSLVTSTAPVIYVDGVRIYAGSQGNFWNSWRSQNATEKSYGAGQDAMALDMFRPEDIESIEVIKGPAAATLYGAEAANGVIQIITKKGRSGPQEIQWDAKVQAGKTDWAVSRVTNYTTCTPAIIASTISGEPRFPGCQGVAPGTILRSTSLDQPGALRRGDLRGYAVSARGGGTGYSFFAAANRDAEEGVFHNNMHERTAARANFSIVPSSRVDFSVNVGYSKTHTQFPINDDGYGLIQSAVLYRPGYDVPTDEPGRQAGFDGGNGPDRIYQWDNHLRAARMTIGTTVNYRPVSWLVNRLTVGIDQNDRLADKYLPPGSIWGGDKGIAERAAPSNLVYTVDYAGTVTTLLPWALSSAASVGLQYTSSQHRNTTATGSGFSSGTIRQVSLAASTGAYTAYVDQKSLGMYVQEQVGWNDRLYVTGALRVDNNSVFGDEIKQLYYPKLAVSWIISEEPFFARRDWLSSLKLRTAWGQAGSAPAPFAGQRSYTAGATVDENGVRVPALRPNTYGNEKIKPERGTEIELGFDASLFGDRLGAEFTYYDKTTRDALMEVAVAASTGFAGVRLENLGEITNRGMEMAFTGRPYARPGFEWDSRVSLSLTRNRLVSFGDDRAPITLALYSPVQRHQPGFPLGGYWGNFPERDASGALARDANGNLIASAPRYIGPSTPTRELFFANTFVIRRDIQLHALIDYKGGHYLYNVKDQYRCWGQPFANSWSRDPDENMPGQCWEVNDPDRGEESKEIRQQDPGVNNGLFIQRADFIKIRDVSLTYTLPQTLSRRIGTDRAALTFAGHNLGFLWKPYYTGPDPEVNFTGVNDPGGQFAFIRVDSWTAPMTRRFSTSLDVSF
jgi:TonB-linked SusC/RagA family outer membrane protein